jgi:hypothetical protein
MEVPKVMVRVGAKEVVLRATVNEPDLSLIKFQWFKLNKVNSMDEAILANPTATTNKLVLESIKPRDAGAYKCQATRDITKETVITGAYLFYTSLFLL